MSFLSCENCGFSSSFKSRLFRKLFFSLDMFQRDVHFWPRSTFLLLFFRHTSNVSSIVKSLDNFCGYSLPYRQNFSLFVHLGPFQTFPNVCNARFEKKVDILHQFSRTVRIFQTSFFQDKFMLFCCVVQSKCFFD